MIPKECKRLAEVDFPIAVVSKHAAKEKSIRHGHPSTLHLWWARRPLAACRAMLMALLLPDPCDELCPPDFNATARTHLLKTRGRIGDDPISLRKALLKFIGDFANWDLASDPVSLEVARGLVTAAHPEETPLVVDPFAGGGSIPLEALRLGCETFASDLNPVACLILKVMLEDIPRHGPGLAEQLHEVGAAIKAATAKELENYYPPDPDGSIPIAYLWARTVRCESPNCGAEIPLVRSFWLCKRSLRKCALRYHIVRPRRGAPAVEFEVFHPTADNDVPAGTVTRAKATCPSCRVVLGPDRVRAQLREQRGGADAVFDEDGHRIGGARLLAVVSTSDEEAGRHYRAPTPRDYEAVWKSQLRLQELACESLPGGLSVVPDEPTPSGGGAGAGRAFSVQLYGMMQWGDLFTSRQKQALLSLARGTRAVVSTGARELAALNLGRAADYASSLCSWKNTTEKLNHTFGRQALPIMWDFTEVNLAGDMAGNFSWIERVSAREGAALLPGATVQQSDAAGHPLPEESAAIWFTDPPYYDAIPYSDLSDFFFVWLKRVLPNHPLLRDPYDPANRLTPKHREAVQDESRLVDGRPKDRAFFEEAMGRAFAEGRRVLKEDGIGSVVFAHKTTEGWEALLSGMIHGGWTITGSWPIATEMGSRLRARESAALATSVHLVCRPRPDDAAVGDWGSVLRELPKRVGDWMERLQREGVRGADLVFACIGPALEIYSRYSKVVDAEEREIPLGGNPEASNPHERGYLTYVWEVVGRTALEQVLGTAEAKARNGAAGALEEDARLTALFLWTMETTDATDANASAAQAEDDESDDDEEDAPRAKKKSGLSLPFDVVRRFAQPLGIHIPVWEHRIIEIDKGVVRLLPVHERAQQLFGEAGASVAASELESNRRGPAQLSLFPDAEPAPTVRGRSRRRTATVAGSETNLESRRDATTLDRVHAAMLLQSSGHTNALRRLLETEQERSPDFVRLANALSALYPRESDEKRLLDAMLLAVPR